MLWTHRRVPVEFGWFALAVSSLFDCVDPHLKMKCAVLCAVAALTRCANACDEEATDRVLLSSVSSLSFSKYSMTTGRRSAPMQQMQCVKGSACNTYAAKPHTMECHNRGWVSMKSQFFVVLFLDSLSPAPRFEMRSGPMIWAPCCGAAQDTLEAA
jgi:hypothetical protein